MVGMTRHELPVEFNQFGGSRCNGVIRGAFLRLLAIKGYEFREYCTFVNVNQPCVTMDHFSYNCGTIRKIAITQALATSLKQTK